MLSTDEKSQLKKISSDERVCDDDNQHQVEVVDLFNKTCLNDNNPLPKFSIRDYVFATRCKDIKTHWPFSSKNLQLCLNHGVKDVLPPFQTLESIRNPISTPQCAPGNVETNSIEVVPSSDKVEINTQNPVKKCRLSVVKLSNVSEPKSKENTVTKMASKVCPVCKTFTSSSNTTLNAHIDRCLFEQSNVKNTADDNTRVIIKHRIKPRKTRLMVDIYATALSSTLEDLDRRNGTNWTSNNLVSSAGEKKNKEYSSCVNKNDDEGAVYYDSNGTKLRILSKFSDLQSDSKAYKDDCVGRKLVERDKGSKHVLSKKNKYLAPRKNKILITCSPMLDNCTKVNSGEEKEYSSEEEEDFAQVKSDDFGRIKQWVGSKRSGPKKKINPEHEKQHQDIVIKDLRVNSKLPLLADKFVKRTNDSSFPNSSNDNPPLATESHKRVREYSLLESRDSHHRKKNRAASSSTGSRVVNSDESSFIRSRMSQHHILSTGVNENGSLKKTSSDNVPLSGGKKKLTSLRKNMLSVMRHNNASVSKSNKNLQRKHQLHLKKPRQHHTSGSYEDAVEQLGENAAQMEKASSKSSITESNIVGGNVPAGTSDPVKEVEENRNESVCEPVNPNNISFGDQSLISSDFLETINDNEGGINYFADVDPIPIPGPPGSFLPSPDRMPSIEPQPNSSLTDMDSSDSPISLEHNRVESSRANSVLPEMSKGRFGNCQPFCCCSRKVGVVASDANNPSTPSSTSNNPVLRLMGKNLMVVNKEDNVSPQTRPTDYCTVNSQIEHYLPHHHHALSRSFVNNTPKYMPLQQHFDYVTSSDCSRVRSNLATPEYTPHPSSNYNFTPDRHETHIRSYEVEKVRKHKEVTVLHDLPENEYSYGQNRCYPMHDSARSRIVRNANYTQITEPSEGTSNRNSVNWNHPNSLTVLKASAGHDFRSSMYFSSSFSSLPTNFT